MILDVCGERSNRERDAEGLPRAGSGEGSGRKMWGGLTGRRGWGGQGGQEGGGGRERQFKEEREGEMERGERRWDGEARVGRGRQGGGEKGTRGGGISQMDMMECLVGHRL